MKNSRELKELSKKYFKAFQNKDLNKLRNMFSDSIRLIDWDNNISGIDNVLSFNKNIFDGYNSINIAIEKINCDVLARTALCKILITLKKDEEQILPVIDQLTFDTNGLIEEIKAEKFKND